MGIFNTYGSVQLKIGDLTMAEYSIGDAVDIPDGLYLGHDGFVAIIGGRLSAEWPMITDTHKHQYEAGHVLRVLWGLTR